MRLRRFVPVVLTVLSALSLSAMAQNLDVPQPSPKAKAEQRVGITDFTIDYSSPGVKGRPIWGALVPWDKVWRTGANAPTKLTASREFSLGGTKVPAGTYSVFSFPGQAGWKVVLNSDAEAGTDEYDEKKNVASVTVRPETLGASRERMTFIFSDATDTTANLDLEWEKLRIRLPLSVDTKAHVSAEIEKATGDAWRPHTTAARYLHDSGGDLDQALALVDTSIAVKSTWYNNWIKAQILAKKGNRAGAVAAAEASQKLGPADWAKDMIAKSIADWKK